VTTPPAMLTPELDWRVHASPRKDCRSASGCIGRPSGGAIAVCWSWRGGTMHGLAPARGSRVRRGEGDAAPPRRHDVLLSLSPSAPTRYPHRWHSRTRDCVTKRVRRIHEYLQAHALATIVEAERTLPTDVIRRNIPATTPASPVVVRSTKLLRAYRDHVGGSPSEELLARQGTCLVLPQLGPKARYRARYPRTNRGRHQNACRPREMLSSVQGTVATTCDGPCSRDRGNSPTRRLTLDRVLPAFQAPASGSYGDLRSAE